MDWSRPSRNSLQCRHIAGLLAFGVLMVSGCIRPYHGPQRVPGASVAHGAPVPVPRRYVPGLTLTPKSIIAPVNSQVVLIASVAGPDERLQSNQRVEWHLASDAAARFVTPSQGGTFKWLRALRDNPYKVSDGYAISTTLARNVTIGGSNPEGGKEIAEIAEIAVLRGQAWIRVTSPTEGTSHVTSFAPKSFPRARGRQTTTIHWVDAQTDFPVTAINPVGTQHTFTTTVLRHTDHTPVVGWLVRYEITEGPPAGFFPSGAQTMEAVTDESGRANVQIIQQKSTPGTNQIHIQVIRPAKQGGSEVPLVVHRGSVLATWSAPDIAIQAIGPSNDLPATGSVRDMIDLDLTGPTTASVGEEVEFDVTITNRRNTPIEQLHLHDTFDRGLEFVDPSNPERKQGKDFELTRQIEQIQPNEAVKFKLRFRVRQTGTLCHTLEISDQKSIRKTARACVVVIQESKQRRVGLKVTKSGPEKAPTHGGIASFQVRIENTGNVPLTNLRIADNYDEHFLKPQDISTEGYRPEDRGADDVVWKINRLEPGKTFLFQVDCQCMAPTDRTCSSVVVTCAEQQNPLRDEVCVQIPRDAQGLTEPEAPTGKTKTPAVESNPENVPLSMSLADTSDPIKVGGETTYEIVVKNLLTISVKNVQLEVRVPDSMRVVKTGGPATSKIDGQTVRFSPIPELRPNENPALKYTITVRADKAGENLQFKAILKCESMKEPLAKSIETTVYAESDAKP